MRRPLLSASAEPSPAPSTPTSRTASTCRCRDRRGRAGRAVADGRPTPVRRRPTARRDRRDRAIADGPPPDATPTSRHDCSTRTREPTRARSAPSNPRRSRRRRPVAWSDRRRRGHHLRAFGRTGRRPRAASVEPNGSGPSSLAQASGRSAAAVGKQGGTAVSAPTLRVVPAARRPCAGDRRPATLSRRRPAARTSRARAARCSSGGSATARSRRVDRPPRGDARRERVRVLRRPAVRQRPAALRPPADRLREGRRAPLPDDARAAASSAASAGTATACRPRWRPRRSSASPGTRRSPSSASTSSTTPAARACCGTPTSGSATSPARPAGSTSSNDYKTLDLAYMESVMWAFKTLWDKGLDLRGLPGAGRTAGAARRRCQQHRDPHGRRLPRPPGPGAHRAVRARRRGERGCWRGRPRRGRCRPTSPSPSAPTSTTR